MHGQLYSTPTALSYSGIDPERRAADKSQCALGRTGEWRATAEKAVLLAVHSRVPVHSAKDNRS